MHKHWGYKCITISQMSVSEHILTRPCIWLTKAVWSGYNIKWCCNSGRKGEGSWCVSYFRNAGEETYWSGTLRLDKDVRFKRSKVIIKYTTGRCCWKKNIYCFTHQTHSHSHTRKHTHLPTISQFSFPLYLSLSCQRWKENLISIRLNCGGQHYQFKRPGDLTAPTPRWLITSQPWWAILSSLSFTLVKRRWWLGATHDKCCPYYWSHWKRGPGNIRLQPANHTLSIPEGQKILQDTNLCLLLSVW